MSNKKKRFSVLQKIPPIAGLDYRHLLDGQGKLLISKNLSRIQRRRLQKEAKKLGRKYQSILLGLSTSGAGLPPDQLLRQFAIEYTQRYASSGIHNQPLSFNYIEAFCNIKLISGSVAPFTELTNEYDHLFYATDFFDYLTSSDSDGFNLAEIKNLPENKTYHFSTNGDVNDISFLHKDGRDFVFSSFSMIRRGNSLHWFLLGGDDLGQGEWYKQCVDPTEIHLENITPSKQAFLRDSVKEKGSTRGAPLPLEGTSTGIRTIATGEMDLTTQKSLAKCIMREYENLFDIKSDDPEILIGINDPTERKELAKSMMREIDDAAVIWDLAAGFFQLPEYFSCKATLEKEVLINSGRRLIKNKGGAGIKRKYRTVSSIEITTKGPSSVIRKTKLPHYETEIQGHWRRLNLEAHGKDRYGNSVQGKTWVNASNPWRSTKANQKTVFVKDSIGAARLEIAEYITAANEVQEKAPKFEIDLQNTKGELYVMRCSAMKEPIYKVGFTMACSEDRANQLSSATGVPMSFVVVKKWQHKAPKELETEVHAMLSPYRLNKGREFFQAKFEVIENIIEIVIARI